MGLHEYCPSQEHDHHEGIDTTCAAGLVVIFLQIMYIPFVTVGGIITIVAICFAKNLHTPHNIILMGIAIVDLMTCLIFTPFQLTTDFPGAEHIIPSQRWTCSWHFNNAWFCSAASLDLLTILCVDRLLMNLVPIWYISRTTWRKNIGITVAVISGRFTIHLVVWIHNVAAHSDTEWTYDMCNVHNTLPQSLFYVETYLIFTEMIICIGLCSIQVALYCRTQKHTGTPSPGRYSKSEEKWEAIKLSSLVLTSIFLWMPTIIYLVMVLLHEHDALLNDLGRLFRLLNAGLHAPIHAATRTVYRDSFRFLLTTSPCSWNKLSKCLSQKSSIQMKQRDIHNARKDDVEFYDSKS